MPTSTRCCTCGAVSATTRGRAICIAPPASSRRSTAASFPTPLRPFKRCRGSAGPLRRPSSPRVRDSARQSSMPTSSGCWRAGTGWPAQSRRRRHWMRCGALPMPTRPRNGWRTTRRPSWTWAQRYAAAAAPAAATVPCKRTVWRTRMANPSGIRNGPRAASGASNGAGSSWWSIRRAPASLSAGRRAASGAVCGRRRNARPASR